MAAKSRSENIVGSLVLPSFIGDYPCRPAEIAVRLKHTIVSGP